MPSNVGHDAHGAQHHVSVEHFFALLGLDVDLAALARGVHSRDLAGGHDVDAGLFEAPGELLAHLLVFDRHDVGHVLHNGDLRANGVVEVGEFDADGAGPDDDQLLGLLLHRHGLAVTDDLLSVLREVGKLTAAGASGDDDVVGFDHLLGAFRIGDLHLAARHQLAVAHDDINLVLLHEELHAFGHAVRDTA